MKGPFRPLRIFLCHCSEDKPAVRKLYEQLKSSGTNPWLDEENLLPGQQWKQEIPKAVRKSDIVLVCLSPKAITKSGYVQKEIRFALDIAEEKPEDTIFLIPVKLEECEVPQRLADLQWVNLFEPQGFQRLLRALKKGAESLNIKI
ncbi:MAG: toll/interleukin-1 receptor domain-containing protein [Chloroflexi bacterium]|nr:toll/interleukin-1 receptor domain-containing protein [Chloroflexota bacterium]